MMCAGKRAIIALLRASKWASHTNNPGMDHLAAAQPPRPDTLSPVRPYLDDPLTQNRVKLGRTTYGIASEPAYGKVDVKISATELETAISVLARLANKDAKAEPLTGSSTHEWRASGWQQHCPTHRSAGSMCIRKHNPGSSAATGLR